MKNISKILLFSFIINCLLFSSIFAVSYYKNVQVIRDKTISMYFNGHKLSLVDSNTQEKYYPLLYRDRTYIPVRAFLNVVGVNVDWDEENDLALFETDYDIKTGQKLNYLNNWYKEQYYNQQSEEQEILKEEIETISYIVDENFIYIPKLDNIKVDNKELVVEDNKWLGKSKEYLREYVFISEPLIIKEKKYNYGLDLGMFYEQLRETLKQQGFSMLSEQNIDNGYERKYVKENMNLYVIKTETEITLKIIKGTMIDR